MTDTLTVRVQRRRTRRRRPAKRWPDRLDLIGHDGLVLARAYDRWQVRWGDPRRAFVSGDLLRRQARTAP